MNIGIVSVWFQRGAGYIASQVSATVENNGHNVHILARASFTDNKKRLDFSGEFHHTSIFLNPTYLVDDSYFEKWLTLHKIDKVIFIEEQFTINLVQICNRLQVPSYNYVVWENINPGDLDFYRLFTKIICPTEATFNLLSNCGMKDIVYVPWGVDLKKFRYHEPKANKKVRFFFSGGWGGVHERKNEDAVMKSFSRAVTHDNIELCIHSQKEGLAGAGQNYKKTSGSIPAHKLIELISDSDVSLIPSRWEGNGLPVMESMALGRPCISVDALPMSERVVQGETGYLCRVKEFKTYPNIFVQSAEIDIDDMTDKIMQIANDRDKLYTMQIQSRKYAVEHFDWEQNSKKLSGALE